MYYVNVVIIKDGVVDEAHLFTGEDHDKVSKNAEIFFCKKLKELAGEIVLDDEDMEAILDDGYFELHHPVATQSRSICITWPEVVVCA